VKCKDRSVEHVGSVVQRKAINEGDGM
jgi:hypothetical protein